MNTAPTEKKRRQNYYKKYNIFIGIASIIMSAKATKTTASPTKTANASRGATKAPALVRAISAKGVSMRSPINMLSPMKLRSAQSARSEGIDTGSKCNNDIKAIRKYSSFIFFGCWNNVNCKKEYVYRDIVLDYIHNNEKTINQLYIAGDNWYTNIKNIDGVNYKVYLTDILTRGYDKLYSMNKEIYIAVGNHDEDKNADAADATQALQKDCNINTQKYYLKKIKDLKAERVGRTTDTITEPTLESLEFDAKAGKLTDSYLCKNGVYIYVEDIGVRYNKGNIVIIINTNKFDDYDEGLEYLERIRAFIEYVVGVRNSSGSGGSGEQIFVMGHIPLFNFKKDEIQIQDINKKKPKFREIIVGLFDMFVENNIIYICADTHNFSIMRIKCNNSDARVLIQITAGSGGADPDFLTTEYATKPTTKTINLKEGFAGYNFEIEAYALNSYGYATVSTGTINNITVCYKQIIKDNEDITTATMASAATNITEITYKIDKATKTISEVKATNPEATINIHKNTEICKKIEKPTRGYITSLNHKTACFKKDIDKKDKDKKDKNKKEKT
jgi:hypothetical protein